MLNPTTVKQQYEQANQDNLKILIVGAGIAGVTAAQLLRKNGHHPVLIERHTDNSHPGYMLALMPMVDAVFDDLEVRNEYRNQSTALKSFGFHSHKGKLIREDSMGDLLNRFGDYRGIARGELLEVLTTRGCDVVFGTTVTAMNKTNGCTQVTLKTKDDTCQLEFDLIIISDGIHSSTRKLVLGSQPINVVNTHWGGWVVWAPEDDKMGLGEELWGAGFFYGVYPVKGKLGVFLGGALEDTKQGPEKFVAAVRKKLTTINPRMESCLNEVAKTPDAFFWLLDDCRCHQWAFDNTILLGDAAAGFLPTAGVGAGMAMESAWVLSRMLRYADKENIATLLQVYEKSQRPRVEAAQETSRGLAKIMFRQSKFLAAIRDLSMRLISVEMAIRPIKELVAHKPDPDNLAQKSLKNKNNGH